MMTWMKNVNSFQIAEFQPHGVAYHLVEFWPVSGWRCFKSVAYKRKRVIDYKRLQRDLK